MKDIQVDERGNPVSPEPQPARLPARRQPKQQMAVIPTTPAEMLGLAVQNGASVEQLDKLISLMERTRAIEARQAYVTAMAQFKQDPPTIIKNKTAKMQKDGRDLYSYGFADLAAVCGGIVEALAKVDISHAWTTTQANGLITVTCTLTHAMGHSESTALSAGADQSGGKNSVQAIGSTVKYLERYTLLAITGIAVQDNEDDDGAGASPVERAEMRQAARDMKSNRNPRPADVAAQRQQAPKAADPQLLADARFAADHGRGAFETFWKGINGEKRTALGPELDNLQQRCDAADAQGAK
jgi:hypothetical protein